ALNKLLEEDPSLTVIHNPETHEVIGWGQGEMHLRVATERLAGRFGVPVTSRPPSVGYRETIRKGAVQRGRHKKQSGGHGQFGDVVLEIQPVPLEPIHSVEIVCPSEATAKINAILSGRRGQILGFDTREGWVGWDTVRALMPESEIGDLIVEVRSATAGVGSFTFKFDHMAELTGKQAGQIG